MTEKEFKERIHDALYGATPTGTQWAAVVAVAKEAGAKFEPKLPGKLEFEDGWVKKEDGILLCGGDHLWLEAAVDLWNAWGPEGTLRKRLEAAAHIGINNVLRYDLLAKPWETKP